MPFDPKSDDTLTLEELKQLCDAQTEPIKPVTAATANPATEEFPAIATTRTMPAITAARLQRRRFGKWLNTWGPTKVLVLPTAAVVGLWIGTLIAVPQAVPDAATPDFFAKKPPVTQPANPAPSETPSASVSTWPANDDTATPRRVELQTPQKPKASNLVKPSKSTSASPSSIPTSFPSLETPGKGGDTSSGPSASTTTPPVLPSDTPTLPTKPEETIPPTPSEPAPSSEPAPPAAETRAAAAP